ncbi:uncharacterized protein LOC133835658 [Drosophila sulfurigaster albostrigata]|uniref:uncharacterized protein LOC133835658 n=1 Tax=Drosophila sulfurigaster albostrigata TaxID=89887 RepID=UPI002D21D351|nr:uncharacterized protein LOC133835658 [Drosophila sulfurigaster albostrigata]
MEANFIGVESSPHSFKKRMHSKSNPSRVSAGALASVLNSGNTMKSGSTLLKKEEAPRKANTGVASVSGYGAHLAKIVLSTSQVKKSLLTRKPAGLIVSSNVKSGAKSKIAEGRKVKFSAIVHTFPSSQINNKKSLSIGAALLKKRINKFKRKPPSGENLCKSSTFLKRDVVQQNGTSVDVELNTERKLKGKKTKTSITGQKVNKPRIKVGTSGRQLVLPSNLTRSTPTIKGKKQITPSALI